MISRMGLLLPSLILLFLLTVNPATAEMSQPQSRPNPLSNEKVMAKEKAVEEHAKKRTACNRQAKEQKLGLLQRRAFVKECMAK